MVTPSKDEIREEALRVYMEESYRAGLEDIPTPEDHELKEGNYWLRAQTDLMTSPEAKATDEHIAYLEYSASELEEVVVKSENLKDLLAASRKLEGLEARIKDLRQKRRQEKEEAKLRIVELERQLEEARVVVEVPVGPPPPLKELTDKEMKRLEDVFKASLSAAGLYPPRFISEFRVEIGAAKFLPYDEARDVIERLTKEIITRAKPIVRRPPRVRAPILEPIEREPDFETYLKRCGIDMEDYRLLGHIGQTVMRQEYRRWKKDPW